MSNKVIRNEIVRNLECNNTNFVIKGKFDLSDVAKVKRILSANDYNANTYLNDGNIVVADLN